MLKALLSRLIRRFEARYDYDMAYGHALLQTSLAEFMRFLPVSFLSVAPAGVPPGPWFAAKIAATRHGDCGPCTQLVLRVAHEAGLAPALLRAIVQRDSAALDADTALGLAFAEAVLRREPTLDGLREAVLTRWGARGLASLALAITAAGMFPTLKVALGYGQACAMLEIDGESIAPAPAFAMPGRS